MNEQTRSIEVRDAEPQDVPLILRFIRAKAEFDGVPDWVRATEEALHAHLFGSQPSAFVTFGFLNGRPVGFAIYFLTFSSFLAQPGIWLDDLFVDPEARGNGVGAALLTHLAKVADARGYGRIEWVTAVDNEKGLAFYRSRGARVHERVRLLRMDRSEVSSLAREAG